MGEGKKYRLYHGTATGKDDIFLESFIVTGAVSGAGPGPWDQNAGFYTSPSPEWPMHFAKDREPGSSNRNPVVADMRIGRGIIVAIDTAIDGQKWEIDHEMSQDDSLALLRKFSSHFPHIAGGHTYFFDAWAPSDIRIDAVRDSGNALLVDYFVERTRVQTQIEIPWKAEAALGERDAAFFIDKAHKLVKEIDPGKYASENAQHIGKMLDARRGTLKYVASEPLQVTSIQLRPAAGSKLDKEYSGNPPLETWEMIYNRGKKPSLRHDLAAPISSFSSP